MIFLGTSSACPSYFRNISGIYLHSAATNSGVLWDCGESTVAQLMRRFGADKAIELICSLEACFISHFHADHHLGLINLLRVRGEHGGRPLPIVGPQVLLGWLWTSARILNDRLLFTFTSCSEYSNREPRQFAHGLYQIEVAKALHIPDSWGFVVNSKNGKAIYSGDTRPCPSLIEAGKGASLVIHEATFEDQMAEAAKLRRHSTISEAIETGLSMSPEATVVLTHFSQRYPGAPPISHAAIDRVMVAFDFMTISLRQQQVKKLPALLPRVQQILSLVLDEGEESLARRFFMEAAFNPPAESRDREAQYPPSQ